MPIAAHDHASFLYKNRQFWLKIKNVTVILCKFFSHFICVGTEVFSALLPHTNVEWIEADESVCTVVEGSMHVMPYRQ